MLNAMLAVLSVLSVIKLNVNYDRNYAEWRGLLAIS